ncbi:MAG: class I SAM-dependent methyltransferase [Evtepia sp.]
MIEYAALANCYDALTTDVNYEAWADYLEKRFRRSRHKIHTVLDLACGTGTLSLILAERGYEMIGVDCSPEMLSQASEKVAQCVEKPIFLCQSMEKLDLYGTVDACICMLDSVNHVTNPKKLKRAFERVHLFLEPGGIFIFDCLTERHFEEINHGLFIGETDTAYCVWRSELQKKLCTYEMDIFQKDGTAWQRGHDSVLEYAYSLETLTEFLEQAGFCNIHKYGNLKLTKSPTAEEERVFFSAEKGK